MPDSDTSRRVAPGDRIRLHYTLSLPGGKVVDTTRGAAPAELVIGESELLPAFERCILELRVGEARRFEIGCADAFGPSELDGLHAIPRAEFPQHLDPKPGPVVGFELPSGEEIPGTVVEVAANDIYVNFSHPLAGYDLIFDVEIVHAEPTKQC